VDRTNDGFAELYRRRCGAFEPGIDGIGYGNTEGSFTESGAGRAGEWKCAVNADVSRTDERGSSGEHCIEHKRDSRESEFGIGIAERDNSVNTGAG
jgi:hypothetical protein